MDENGQSSAGPQDPKQSRGLRNILDTVLLLAGLAAAWFVMDWLMNGK
jgi:hypothetical protein